MVKSGNISSFDRVISVLLYFKVKIEAFSQYRKAYRNYGIVVMRILRHEFPIDAIVRDTDQALTFHDHMEAIYLTSIIAKNIQYDVSNNVVTIRSFPYPTIPRDSISLIGALHNGDVAAIFLENIYGKLPVNGMTVIDIGGNIGDSSVYFALRGAKRVIALEPFSESCELARKNIALNGLSDRIIILQAGCGGNKGYVGVDPAYKSQVGSTMDNITNGHQVPILPLGDILTENGLSTEDVILKIDCEGCEYDAILLSNEVTLRHFSHIQIEYHHGYEDLKEKLRKAGFEVSATRPIYSPARNSPFHIKTDNYVGYVYADRTSVMQ